MASGSNTTQVVSFTGGSIPYTQFCNLPEFVNKDGRCSYDVLNVINQIPTQAGSIVQIVKQVTAEGVVSYFLTRNSCEVMRKWNVRTRALSETSELTIAQFESPVTRKIYPISELVSLANYIKVSKIPYKLIDAGGCFNINTYIAWVIRLPGIAEVFRTYSMIFDNQLETGDIMEGFTGETTNESQVNAHRVTKFMAITGSPQPLATPFNQYEAEFLAMMLILCSQKTFVTDEQYDSYMKKRCSAYAQSCGYEGLDWDIGLKDKMVVSDLRELSRRLSFYPKMRKALFSHTLTSDEKWAVYAKSILRDSQLSTFNFIYLYVTEYPSQALFLPAISAQVRKFISVYNLSKQKYGDLLTYAKLINPDDETMATNNWPQLAAISICGVSGNLNLLQLKQFKRNIRIGNDIKRAMARPVNANMRVGGAMDPNFSTDELDFMKLDPTFTPGAADAFVAESSDLYSAFLSFDAYE